MLKISTRGVLRTLLLCLGSALSIHVAYLIVVYFIIDPGTQLSGVRPESGTFDPEQGEPLVSRETVLPDILGTIPSPAKRQDEIERSLQELAILDRDSRWVRGTETGAGAPSGLSTQATSPAEIETRVKVARERARRLASPTRLVVELDDSMYRGQEYSVGLAIQAEGSDGTARALKEFSEQSPAATLFTDQFRATDELRASISAADFTIVAERDGWQNVVPEAATIWTWRITPRTSGKKTITFFLDQRVWMNGEEVVIPVDNYPRVVVVSVTATGWIVENFVWFVDRFWTQLLGLLALVGGLVAFIQLWKWYGPSGNRRSAQPVISPAGGPNGSEAAAPAPAGVEATKPAAGPEPVANSGQP